MKILIVLKDITESGGGERVAINLANAFMEQGFEVEVLSFFKLNTNLSFALTPRIHITYLSSLSPKTKNIFLKLFCKSVYRYYLCKKAHSYILKSKPSMVLANDGWFIPPNLFDNALYLRLWHLNAPKKISQRKRDIFALFHTLIILSTKELPLWQSYHKDVRVIANFLPFIPTAQTDISQKRIVSIGRMDRGDQKGFLRLIDIWALVQQSLHKSKQQFSSNFPSSLLDSWQLIIVGEGELKSEIESKIKALHLEDSILLKPFTKEIEKEYLNASIYAMTSLFEGFGMVLVEASSYALPCIAFDVKTGPSDIIEHKKSGYLIEDNDLQGYANALIELMSDENRREEMGKYAKQRVKESFSKEAIMPLWEEVFKHK
ncbi:MAG: glycosyltransferase family 4 protein [Helicobacter sp.]|uniref:glycosyltransferase family 4 protein n=1 Tax=Helicobacter sp. TaxID=218 RepID=UPI0025BF9418|nr:glycosyltransferase family 4 protein [Helicobacter sp.]MCH5313476.1 glycosyltransferase family 4 protein [Helicobacter sp.]